MHQHHHNLNSRGFTLIELLVAISIVMLLAGILLVTLNGAGTAAKVKATRTTIIKINTILDGQRNDFVNATQKLAKAPYDSTCIEPLGTNVSEKYSDLIHLKRLYKQAFPQRAEDLLDENGGNDTQLGKYLESKGIAFNDVDNSELLYLICTQGSAYGTTTVDAGNFEAKEVADADEDGLLEIVDAWDNPIRFYRWPTRLIRPLNPADTDLSADTSQQDTIPTAEEVLPVATDVFWKLVSSDNIDSDSVQRDPDDQFGIILRTLAPASTSSYDTRRNRVLFFEGDTDSDRVGDNNSSYCTFHTPNTYHTFLLISAGPDLTLGLEEPEDVTNFGHLAQPSADSLSLGGGGPLNDSVTNLKSEEK